MCSENLILKLKCYSKKVLIRRKKIQFVKTEIKPHKIPKNRIKPPLRQRLATGKLNEEMKGLEKLSGNANYLFNRYFEMKKNERRPYVMIVEASLVFRFVQPFVCP